jgi:hypothetical protein
METQGLDCRRHGLREEGRAFGGRAATICGRLGKTDNCQVAVTLSIANHQASLPIAYRLYLPEEWANDAARRSKAHVPDDVKFRTKPDLCGGRAVDDQRLASWHGASAGQALGRTRTQASRTRRDGLHTIGVCDL